MLQCCSGSGAGDSDVSPGQLPFPASSLSLPPFSSFACVFAHLQPPSPTASLRGPAPSSPSSLAYLLKYFVYTTAALCPITQAARLLPPVVQQPETQHYRRQLQQLPPTALPNPSKWLPPSTSSHSTKTTAVLLSVCTRRGESLSPLCCPWRCRSHLAIAKPSLTTISPRHIKRLPHLPHRPLLQDIQQR